MLATAPANDVQFTKPIYTRDGCEYWVQLPDKSIALGGFEDANGDNEWTYDNQVSQPVQSKLEEYLRCHLKT